jgi:hypothetical protein
MNCFSPGIAAFLYALPGVCARRSYLVIMQQRKRGESHFFLLGAQLRVDWYLFSSALLHGIFHLLRVFL